jgi:hypothetical protein
MYIHIRKARRRDAIRAILSFKSWDFLQNPCRSNINVRHFVGHIVVILFVFIHIPASNGKKTFFFLRTAREGDILFSWREAKPPGMIQPKRLHNGHARRPVP